MDPLTHGIVGATNARASLSIKSRGVVAIAACLAGMAPDLDVLIFSRTDPLLFLEYHRQFTHSLVFIPVGSLLCALAFHPFTKRHFGFRSLLLVCLAGYGVHALLDACTTYGTQLLWPFSSARIAWNNIAIVDPLFTLPVLAFVVASHVRARRWLAWAGLGWAIFYLGLGVVQRDRAEAVATQLAADRGLDALDISALPAVGSLLIWKTVIETQDRFYIDGVRVGRQARVYPGKYVQKLDVERDFPWLDPASQQARDLERFSWFANRYLGLDPARRDVVIDLRYSVAPDELAPLWGIRLDPDAAPSAHVEYVTGGRSPEHGRRLIEMFFN